MNIKVTSIAFRSVVDSDKVQIVIGLAANNRKATFKMSATFGTVHSSATSDDFGLGLKLMLGASVVNAKVEKDDDGDYPGGRIFFPMMAHINSGSYNKPTVWAEGFGIHEKVITNLSTVDGDGLIMKLIDPKVKPSYAVYYDVQMKIPHAVYAYLDGKLKKLHEDELETV